MALATLSIDLEARLAKFQEGMDKAAQLAEKNAAATEAAWARTASKMAGLAGAVAGLFAGFSAVDAVRSAVDALDALNDVADATGASIENLSALEDIARRTGTTMDTVAGALVKLNAQLTDTNPDSGAARALKAIGLQSAELRKLDPAEALRRVAVALNGYADDGNKARLVQELFGKSTREVSPLLKDLADQTQLVATTTAENAAAAERFNKQQAEFRANIEQTSRKLAQELLPSLNRTLEAYSKFGLLGGIVLPALGLDDYSKKARELTLLQEQMSRAADRVARLAEESSRSPGNDFLQVRLNKAREQLAGLQKQTQDASEALKQLLGTPAGKPADDVKPGVGDGFATSDAGKAQQAEKLTAAQRALNAYVNELEREAAKLSDVTEQQKLLNLLRLAGADRDPVGPGMAEYLEGLQRQITLRKQDAAISADNARIAKEREAAEKSLADELYRLSGRAERDRKAALLELLETQKAYGEYTEQELGAILDGLNGKAKETFNELDELSKQFARNIQDALGDTIEQTLAGDFDNIVRLWGNMLTKMASQAAAAELGRAIFGDGFFKQSGAGAGQLGGVLGNLTQYFGNQLPFALAQGGVVSQAGITRFATGGVFDSPTRFSYAGGRIGELGEAGPEAVMPLRRGRDGKLGVAATGGEAGPTVVINIASGVTRPELAALIPGLTQQIKAELRNDARRPGGSF